MLSKLYSYGLNGLEAYPVTIEVDVAPGLPSVAIVGLPDNAVKESKERVRSAIKNSGYKFPLARVTVNLAPADVKKEGPAFDLAIALGVLAATGQINPTTLKKFIFLGELSLDGHIQPVHGVLPVSLTASMQRFQGIILPSANAVEAAVAERLKIYPTETLTQTIALVQEPERAEPLKVTLSGSAPAARDDGDFSDVKGQAHVKRGLEVAAAGGHNVLLLGPPGSGKTMLAKRIITILPDMTRAEMLETTCIHSVMELFSSHLGLMTHRPFRSPHHTSSNVALVGGGSNPRPGEVTLAHHGVLFLDELPEFHRDVLEALRQPMEDQHVTIARASKALRFPSRFMLVGAMNPCPCGQYGNPKASCRCHPLQIQRYRSRISGPLLDRIDIHLDVPAVNYQDLNSTLATESSSIIKERVNCARSRQRERFKGDQAAANAQMSHRQVRKFCALGSEQSELLKAAMSELNFSARAYDKILKISRTIADLAGSEDIKTEHLAEAIQYRSLDRNWWG